MKINIGKELKRCCELVRDYLERPDLTDLGARGRKYVRDQINIDIQQISKNIVKAINSGNYEDDGFSYRDVFYVFICLCNKVEELNKNQSNRALVVKKQLENALEYLCKNMKFYNDKLDAKKFIENYLSELKRADVSYHIIKDFEDKANNYLKPNSDEIIR